MTSHRLLVILFISANSSTTWVKGIHLHSWHHPEKDLWQSSPVEAKVWGEKRRLINLHLWSIDHLGNAGTDCVRVLVGCKADLDEEREVAASQGQKAAEEMESRYFFFVEWAHLTETSFRWSETSALTGSNVDLLFLELTQEMLAKRQVYGPSKGVHDQGPTPRGPGEGREVLCLQQRVESSFRLPKGASLRSKASQRMRKKPDCCS